ncbi:SGNH/GDSL hydrolase family protein [Nocardia inohanensis]|uniref:SGNH/GDSL hydrolase family protein n=1 Tax=Nocardia inohanensis TaxID=209246 RepID=UPI00082EA79E|nr:SGNH/GDSL hydrolase family protein [Nocardia inohanensis]
MTVLTEDTDPYAVPTATAVEMLCGAPWKRMITMGDSVAEGIREPVPGYADLSWSQRLEAVLGAIHPDFTARNLGRRDLTTAEVRATQLDAALEFGPDLAFVTCGGNDMLRPGFDPDRVRAELTTMVSALRARGAEVVTIGLLDLTQAELVPAKYAESVSAATRALARVTEEVSAAHGAVFVQFLDHPLTTDPSIYSSDRLHFNARGHAFAAGLKIHALARHLAGIPR